jgi:ABC-type enterochelin transport system permease subunit
MANLLDLDSIVLSGPSFAVVGSIYLNIIRQRVATEFVARAKHSIRVQLSPQLTDAAAVGGATLIMQKILAPRQLGVVAPVAAWK